MVNLLVFTFKNACYKNTHFSSNFLLFLAIKNKILQKHMTGIFFQNFDNKFVGRDF